MKQKGVFLSCLVAAMIFFLAVANTEGDERECVCIFLFLLRVCGGEERIS